MRALAILLFPALAGTVSAASCDNLASLALPNAKVTLAQSVAAGAFRLDARAKGKGDPNAPFKDAPEFCRVALTLTPTSDSDIKAEVWLPASGWNNKLQVVGNGGWAGVISYPALAAAIKRGYAAASTDTGHVGGRGEFVLGHPEKLLDFSWRSEHETTLKSKAVTQAFYGSAAKYSYWNGCSTGGRQGLKEAQMFPDDYDGIIAGAPANRTALALWIASAVLKDSESYIPPAKYPMIHQAVLDACDAADGLKDGLIDDPTKCKFDPKVLECKNGDGPSCLTTPQVEAARKIYTWAKNPRTGQQMFPSLPRGTELGWQTLGGPEPGQNILDQYMFVVFKNPAWDWRTFDFDKDVTYGNQPEFTVMNATDPNLRPYFGHNGKLLLYHGWSDPNISALATVQYYKSVVDTLGGPKKTSDSIRLFMVPGMGHCGGGEGPNQFDMVSALEQWVEQHKAPEKMIAARVVSGNTERTRPLCPYPQVAKYKGSGSIDDASNFACRVQ